MKFPKFLPKNGTIGFVAPSYGCNIEPYRSAFDHALETFRFMGYQTVLGPNCYEGKGIGISNTPRACGEEVNAFLTGSDSDVILSCGGGELMCEILPYVDFERIRQAEPKWYMGFSDNTNLTFLLSTICDTAAIYGPCAPAFGMEPWHPVLQDAWNLLTGTDKKVHGFDTWEKESLKTEENPLEPYHVTEPKLLKKYPDQDVVLRGRLLGGCLDCLDTLVGTSFDQVEAFNQRYAQDGILWFMESCDLTPMGIRRAVWQLKEAGWFKYTKGFLIGRPLCFGEEAFGLDQYHAVVDLLEEYQVPIIMDVDLGHLPPSMPIVCGSMAEVRVQGNSIQIQYDFV